MAKTLIGVMGPGESATPELCQTAYELGYQIAQQGWGLLTGGRNVGIMAAASQGAKAAGGLTVGILPDSDARYCAEAVDIAVITDLGSARNNINVLSSQVVIACGIGAGTASEIALALKAQRPVILLQIDRGLGDCFQTLTVEPISQVNTATEAIAAAQQCL
ncbi:MAG: TIGR00725 family protein [Cyanobacteria bacterium P01_A01_bin.123]